MLAWVLLVLLLVPLLLLALRSAVVLSRLLGAGRQGERSRAAATPRAPVASGQAGADPGRAPRPHEIEPESSRPCPACGLSVLAGARTCWHCGTPLAH